MITAGDKHMDQFTWGEAEQFHCIDFNGEKFKLFEIVAVEIPFVDDIGFVYRGEIGFIGENSIDILPLDGRPYVTIGFDNIRHIRHETENAAPNLVVKSDYLEFEGERVKLNEKVAIHVEITNGIGCVYRGKITCIGEDSITIVYPKEEIKTFEFDIIRNIRPEK